MTKLIDWICLNCYFVGRVSDRGKECCGDSEIVSMDEYYEKRIKEFKRQAKLKRSIKRGG